jgi:hypothetical protein
MFGGEHDPVLKAIQEVTRVLVALGVDTNDMNHVRRLYVGAVTSGGFAASMREAAAWRMRMTEAEYELLQPAEKGALDVAAEHVLGAWAQKVMVPLRADILYAVGSVDDPRVGFVGQFDRTLTAVERHEQAMRPEVNPAGTKPVILHRT